MDRIVILLASGAYVGSLPVAQGTFGSLLALPILVALAALVAGIYANLVVRVLL